MYFIVNADCFGNVILINCICCRTKKKYKTVSYHSPSGCVPLPLPHHPKGPGAQLLSQKQLTVLDQTWQSPTTALLTLSWAASAPLLPPIRTSTA